MKLACYLNWKPKTQRRKQIKKIWFVFGEEINKENIIEISERE